MRRSLIGKKDHWDDVISFFQLEYGFQHLTPYPWEINPHLKGSIESYDVWKNIYFRELNETPITKADVLSALEHLQPRIIDGELLIRPPEIHKLLGIEDSEDFARYATEYPYYLRGHYRYSVEFRIFIIHAIEVPERNIVGYDRVIEEIRNMTNEQILSKLILEFVRARVLLVNENGDIEDPELDENGQERLE